MKPFVYGIEEAVTRDGRKVTQLKYFEGMPDSPIYGIINNIVFCWHKNGMYFDDKSTHANDLFSPVEYEWQWLIKLSSGKYQLSDNFHKSKEDFILIAQKQYVGPITDERYYEITPFEPSKREAK